MRLITLASAVMMITLIGVTSCADSDNRSNTDSRSEMVALQKAYDRFSQAVADHDVAKLMSFIDPEAEFIDVHSKHTSAAKFEAEVKKNFTTTKDNHIAFTLIDTRIDGAKAAIYLESTYRLKIYDEKVKQWVPLITTGQYDETWEKKDGTWKITRSETLHSDQQIDPQWLAMYQEQLKKQYEMYNKIIEGYAAMALPCNLSTNGCR